MTFREFLKDKFPTPIKKLFSLIEILALVDQYEDLKRKELKKRLKEIKAFKW